ncbi:XRE family transcriptional regulator [Vibrio sp. MA40-2]|uniref:XRE family transcriptional regulator n=1 Tax=Vibrio sp. MA40-2 TaxID=3391828 RepID=UPI0039A63149
MKFTEQDRAELNQVWMSKKATMRLMQMEVVKRLGLNQKEFSELLRGDAPLTMNFINQFCQILHIEPKDAISSLRRAGHAPQQAYLKTKVTVDGEIQRAYIEGNEVVVEYIHQLE